MQGQEDSDNILDKHCMHCLHKILNRKLKRPLSPFIFYSQEVSCSWLELTLECSNAK